MDSGSIDNSAQNNSSYSLNETLTNFVNITKSPNETSAPILPPADVVFWIEHVFFFSILGLISLIGNTVVAVKIAVTKSLRTRFFVILWFLVVIRIVLCATYVEVAIYRILRAFYIADYVMKKAICFVLEFNFYWTQTIEMLLLLGLVIDRLLAIIKFNYYRMLTVRQAAEACSIVCVVTFCFKMIPSAFGEHYDEMAPCVNAYSPLIKVYLDYSYNIDLVLLSIILIVYVYLILYIYMRVRPMMKNPNMQQQVGAANIIAFKRDMKLLPFLTKLVFVHCGIALVTKTLLTLPTYVSPGVGYWLVAAGGSMGNVDLFVNMVVLFVSNKDLKVAIFGDKNSVVSVEPVRT